MGDMRPAGRLLRQCFGKKRGKLIKRLGRIDICQQIVAVKIVILPRPCQIRVPQQLLFLPVKFGRQVVIRKDGGLSFSLGQQPGLFL